MATESEAQGRALGQAGDPEYQYFGTVSGYQEIALEEGDASIERYEKSARATARQQAAKDNELAARGVIPKGFLRLEKAVKRVVGLPDKAVVWNDHPGWLLWEEALRSRRDWEVNCFSLPDEDSETKKTIYVHLGNFRVWAKERGLDATDPNQWGENHHSAVPAAQRMPAAATNAEKPKRGRPRGGGLSDYLGGLREAACRIADQLAPEQRQVATVAKILHREAPWKRWSRSTLERQIEAAWWKGGR